MTKPERVSQDDAGNHVLDWFLAQTKSEKAQIDHQNGSDDENDAKSVKQMELMTVNVALELRRTAAAESDVMQPLTEIERKRHFAGEYLSRNGITIGTDFG